MTISPTLTIGIPAYNEASNIARLVRHILEQRPVNWTLDKIIIYSDGSTDSTVKVIKEMKHNSIKLIQSTSRHGQAYAQQQIIKHTTSDYLVLMNADVLPASNDFVCQLVRPLRRTKVGMTSARVVAMPGDTAIAKIIVWSHRVKSELYATLAPSSVYLCHGRARALSRAFYTRLQFPKIIAEDAFTYLTCLSLNFDFVYCPKASVLFRAPSTLSDHLLQSRRFFRGTGELEKYFPHSLLTHAYHIPVLAIIKSWGGALLQNPLAGLVYFLILAYAFITNNTSHRSTGAVWRPSPTSKQL